MGHVLLDLTGCIAYCGELYKREKVDTVLVSTFFGNLRFNVYTFY